MENGKGIKCVQNFNFSCCYKIFVFAKILTIIEAHNLESLTVALFILNNSCAVFEKNMGYIDVGDGCS